MRTVNIQIKEMDINTEDLLCEIIDRMGYAYNISEVKEKKKKSHQEVTAEFWHRFEQSNFKYIQRFENDYSTCVVVEKDGIYRTGLAKVHAWDDFDIVFGDCLATARACGWADLEKELIESYYD